MVEKCILRVIDLSHIRRRFIYTTTDTYYHQGNETDVKNGLRQFPGKRRNLAITFRQIRKHLVNEESDDEKQQETEDDITDGYACHCFRGRLQILQTGSIQLESPERIEARVGNKSQGKCQGNNDEIDGHDTFHHLSGLCSLYPNSGNNHQQGHAKEIESRGTVEGKTMSNDVPNICRHKRVPLPVGKHKDNLGEDKNQHRHEESPYQIYKPTFHT